MVRPVLPWYSRALGELWFFCIRPHRKVPHKRQIAHRAREMDTENDCCKNNQSINNIVSKARPLVPAESPAEDPRLTSGVVTFQTRDVPGEIKHRSRGLRAYVCRFLNKTSAFLLGETAYVNHSGWGISPSFSSLTSYACTIWAIMHLSSFAAKKRPGLQVSERYDGVRLDEIGLTTHDDRVRS